MQTLVDALRRRAADPNAPAYRFLLSGDVAADNDVGDDVVTRDNGALWRRARAVAAVLQREGLRGERVLLLYAPGLDFLDGFYGCQLAGAIAVPAYPPDLMRLERSAPRLAAIVDDCRAKAVLTTSALAGFAELLSETAPAFAGLKLIATDDLGADDDDLADTFVDIVVGRDDTSFLQYTSGSTGSPKGVIVSHDNILFNQRINQAITGEHAAMVSWLPPYHDMGLIGAILLPLCSGWSCTMLSPLDFLARPRRWLAAISVTGASISPGPNFAYDLCVKKVRDDDKATLDLSSWRLAPNGAEPIRAQTLRRFSAAFAACGFRASAHRPGYGLAEATLTVTGSDPDAPVLRLDKARLEAGHVDVVTAEVAAVAAVEVVSCGSVRGQDEGARVVIVNDGVVVDEDVVGEVWVAGPGVCQGYFGRHDDAFAARLRTGDGPFLRTGDRGFFHHQNLFITGRTKDLLIVRGRNIAPQDLEVSVEGAHPGIRAGCVAAINIDNDGDEAVGIVAEVSDAGAVDDIARAIVAAVGRDHDVAVAGVWLLPPQALPKTSSGKLMRQATRAAALSSSLTTLHTWRPSSKASSTSSAAVVHDDVIDTGDARGALVVFLRDVLAEELQVSPSSIDVRASVFHLGVDSVVATTLVTRLEDHLGRTLDGGIVFAHPSVLALAEHLCAPSSSSSTTAGLRVQRADVDTTAPQPVWWGEDMLFTLQEQQPQQAGYVLFLPLRAAGVVDVEALQRAFEAVLARQDNLRTAFARDADGRVVRRVVDAPFVLEHDDVRGEDAAEDAAVAAASDDLRHTTFRLEAPPLLRAKLVITSSSSVLLVAIHHLVADAWGLAVFQADLEAALALALTTTSAVSLPPLSLRAVDHAVASDAFFAAPSTSLLPLSSFAWPKAPAPGADPMAVKGERHLIVLDEGLRARLAASGRERGFSLSLAAMGAFAVALADVAHSDESAFLVVHANRRQQALRDVVGFFVYGELWSSGRTATTTWREVLDDARRFVLTERPTAQPRAWREQPPGMRVLLNFHNAALTTTTTTFSPAFELSRYPYLWDTHDVLVQVFPTPAAVVVSTVYRPGAYSREVVEGLIAGFVARLGELADGPDGVVSSSSSS